MGFHPLDIIVIVAVGLLLFGPKTLQTIARSTGKGLGQVNDMKNKAMSELHMDELSQVTHTLSQIPTSPQQAARKIITSAVTPAEENTEAGAESAEKPAQEAK